MGLFCKQEAQSNKRVATFGLDLRTPRMQASDQDRGMLVR